MIKKSEARSPADQFIGMRLRECRLALGLSQHQFGELIGVTSQQVYKYERAINSVTAGRLYEIARKLGTPLESFFEGLDRNHGRLPQQGHRLLDIMRNVGVIKNEKWLEAISRLVRVLAGHEP